MTEGTRTDAGRGAHRGVVFTPPALAARLAALLPGSDVPVLDPACGEGELLVAALGAGPRREAFGIEVRAGLARRAAERLAELPAPSDSPRRVRHADALHPDTPWPSGTWVLANPPWLSFSGRHAGPRDGPEARALRGAPSRPAGWPSLQGAFLERIARHVGREGTGAVLLLPGPLTELERYGPLRAAVTAHARLEGPPRELGEHAFPGVTEPAVIVVLRPRGAADAGSGGGGENGGASQRPWTGRDRGQAALLAALERYPRLPPRSFADPGVHTGNSAAELVLPPTAGGWPPLRQGRDLAAYALGPASARLRTDLTPGDGRRFRVAAREHYASFPLLLRQTAARPVAALHAEPGYFRNSLLAGRSAPDLDPAFVVAVLNSPVAAAWHRLMFRDARQRSFPQVKVRHLATQPFPLTRRAEDPALHDRVVDMVRRARPDDEAIAERVTAAFALAAAERQAILLAAAQ